MEATVDPEGISITGNDHLIQHAAHKRERIGWDLVRYGFLSRTWKEFQHQHGRSTDPNYTGRTAEKWARKVQTTLWDYVSGVWECRNRKVHDRDAKEARNICRSRLQAQVRQILNNPPQVSHKLAALL